MKEQRIQAASEPRKHKAGSALISALMVASLLTMLGLSMMKATLDGARVVNYQADDYRLTSAVESVGILATEKLWTRYLGSHDGVAGNIDSFRTFLDGIGVADAGPGGAPTATAGTDLLAMVAIPGAGGDAEFDEVNVDALRLLRRDEGESTRLYLTVSASTNRGEGIMNPILNRAIQLVYTVEPEQFEGFEYGLLANNINCVFCHTTVDSTERFFNHDDSLQGSFDKVKVGALESLMIRDNGDGNGYRITHWDADSYIAGTLHVRGPITDHDGAIVHDWQAQTFGSYEFDGDGHLVEDAWGQLNSTHFSPAGDPPGEGENLYLNYPTDYADMPDGKLPTSFPPPFPDDGGINPATGAPSSVGAGNREVDPGEFAQAAEAAEGSISSGVINVTTPDFVVGDARTYAEALFNGNTPSLPSSVQGNVILSGTADNPIVIDGTVAVDGDVVINGYVKGVGNLVVSGSVYVPTDLQYFDGQAYVEGDTPGHPSGPRTFGIAQDGTLNALGLAAGGNIMLGDYLKPATSARPGPYDIVTGDTDGSFNFSLAELSLFNRSEWAKTQPTLPGPGEAMLSDPDPSTPMNEAWSVSNPDYAGADYMPRYYNFGEDNTIPIYNRGELYYDTDSRTWRGDAEVPLTWDEDMLTMWDPNDTSNGALYDGATGERVAAVQQLTPEGGWITNELQKLAIEYFEASRTWGEAMKIDALLYTNNAIFGIVHGSDAMQGQLHLNGAMVCADLGVLAPGTRNVGGMGTSANPPGSPYKIGLRLNYDRRTKNMLRVVNPNVVTLKRTLWNPTANML